MFTVVYMFNGKKWYTHKCSMCCRGWVRITKIKIRCPGVRIFLFNYSNGLDHRFKGIVSWDFLIQFFHESSSPIHWKLNFGLYIFFGKFVEIFASQGAPCTGINDSGGKFAKGINDTGGKFVPLVLLILGGKYAKGINNTGGNFPLVSMTLMATP